MQGGSVFAELLDEKLREGEQSRLSWQAAGMPAAPAHPLLFSSPLRPFRPATYDAPKRAVAGIGTASARIGERRRAPRQKTQPEAWAPKPTAASAAAPARSPRTLSPAQRVALSALVRLGATLTADFTDGDLRTAFRTLARQYHPDTHPAGSEREKAQLARIFADLNAHHRELLKVVNQPDS
jgi:hypothetical protein